MGWRPCPSLACPGASLPDPLRPLPMWESVYTLLPRHPLHTDPMGSAVPMPSGCPGPGLPPVAAPLSLCSMCAPAPLTPPRGNSQGSPHPRRPEVSQDRPLRLHACPNLGPQGRPNCHFQTSATQHPPHPAAHPPRPPTGSFLRSTPAAHPQPLLHSPHALTSKASPAIPLCHSRLSASLI